MNEDIADQLDELAAKAEVLAKDLEYYWEDGGVHELEVFIDPDHYQYLERMYNEAHSFAHDCEVLYQLAERLRSSKS